jgi:hypothetical protein
MASVNEHDFPLLPSQDAKRRRAATRVVKANATRSHLSGSRTTLIDLPPELILEVINYLPGINMDDFQLHALSSLALTSRSLYLVVKKALYATYDSHFCEPYTFLRTMMMNSQLAGFVQNVDIVFGASDHHTARRYHPTARDKRIVKQGLRALGPSDWKEWATRCNAESLDDGAIQNAILLHTPKVRCLSIEDHSRGKPNPWFGLVSKAAAGTLSTQTHRFEHLQSIRVNAGSSTLCNIAPLFRLKSLRKLHLVQIPMYETVPCETVADLRKHSEESTHRLQRLIPSACSNLEELDLECVRYTWQVLEVLVSSSRCLRSLKYEAYVDQLDQLDEDRSWSLYKVLLCQKASLETLDVFCDSMVEYSTRRRIHLRDSLRGFTSLKHLSCPLGMIMNDVTDTFVERLPSSLLTLRTPIRRHTEDQEYVEALKEVANYYQTHLPKLEEVRVVAPEAASWFTYEWESMVQLYSAKPGISFVVEHGDEDDAFSDWDEDASDSSHSSDEVDLYSDED